MLVLSQKPKQIYIIIERTPTLNFVFLCDISLVIDAEQSWFPLSGSEVGLQYRS